MKPSTHGAKGWMVVSPTKGTIHSRAMKRHRKMDDPVMSPMKTRLRVLKESRISCSRGLLPELLLGLAMTRYSPGQDGSGLSRWSPEQRLR